MRVPPKATAYQSIGILTALILLLLSGPSLVRGAGADINEQVARLDLDQATPDDVIRIFGEPQSYVWEGRTLTRDNLPKNYFMMYPNDFSVVINGGRVNELRFEGAGAGYAYQGKLRVGSSLDEALAVLGQPTRTVEGGPLPIGGQDGVLYKDVGGEKGRYYYGRSDHRIHLYVLNHKVTGLYVWSRWLEAELGGGGKLAKLSEQPAGPVIFPKIDRRPNSCDFRREALGSAPTYNPANQDPFQVDLRSYNLASLDLREAGTALTHASFDDRTVWPAPKRMPADFDWSRIAQWGKNPGLGVRSLHARGITGRGVGIAIIDNPLLIDHQEYVERLRLYEENNVTSMATADMHGSAVASIAVGKTVGVAPEADLYYIGRRPTDQGTGGESRRLPNFQYDAQAIERLLRINEQLPPQRKIRVISISLGWTRGEKGYQEITAAAQKAKAAGMLVICSSTDKVHGFKFHGLWRDLQADPNDFASCRPARWGTDMYANHDHLLVPMGARTTASPTGKDEYVFYGDGGWSWAIPYIAGMYALTAQVEPKITPERFWALALKTGRLIETKDGEKTISLGPILDPARLIAALAGRDVGPPREAQIR